MELNVLPKNLSAFSFFYYKKLPLPNQTPNPKPVNEQINNPILDIEYLQYKRQKSLPEWTFLNKVHIFK